MTDRLLPCPFCGSSDLELYEDTVRCIDCSALGPEATDPDQATALWNAANRGNDHAQRLVSANRKLLVEINDIKRFGA